MEMAYQVFKGGIKTKGTDKTYGYSLREFFRFVSIKKYDDFVRLHPKTIQNLIKIWILNLSDKNLRSATIKAKLNAVEHFLVMNDIIINNKLVRKLIPSTDYIPGGDVPFTTSEIQRMLSSTTKLRTKALIHFLASTGARPAAIVDPILRIRHLEDMPHDCKAVKIYEGSREGYWGYLTPEATKALKHYFSSRKLNGEELTSESPVFANHPKSNRKKQEHFEPRSLRLLLTKLLFAAGIKREKTGNRYNKAILYGFRKRFNTILKLNNQVNSNIAEKLMAHKRGLDGSYLKPTKEECFNEFFKAVSELTISDESRDKIKIEKLKVERTEIEELKLELEDFRDMVNTIDKRILFESDIVTGLVPFELPDIPRYSNLRLQQQIEKDPATYGHMRQFFPQYCPKERFRKNPLITKT